MERVDISLLGRDYSLACPTPEKAKLLDAVKLVDQRMQSIKGSGRVSGNERIAVMAAIQIASELLSAKAPDGPLANVAFGDFKRKIEDMHGLIDQLLGPSSTPR
ncbi:cell division protein ZapA [Alcaligenes sp. SDU_A2]|uniref:cell division protein ZapA n=1 Tax=Alcaligenes sp. SDU_A2 TaxID=3136634 RepID=UPI002BB041D9|nr:cell division protein ZapA [Alcaligenes sp.]